MGHWYFFLFISFFLVITGLFIHWSIVVAGALLPLLPMVSLLLRRRRGRSSPERERLS